ncbi:hypothetical protein [Mucilaginibacter flavus]|uniref:hypothetical protein n=1 Tax=Mucilaginibacter flavus TaxID=931504 RepID=UPI0025B62A43|nr:hypothetical protein [Mucilaginibacter flavus]MDN3584280.1 hypothetical protein [Mucilaginibacter flavus]
MKFTRSIRALKIIPFLLSGTMTYAQHTRSYEVSSPDKMIKVSLNGVSQSAPLAFGSVKF